MNKIVGQKKIINWVDNLTVDSFPHFIVLIGAKGSGKRTIAKYIADKLSAVYVECDIKVDAVRNAITLASTVETPIVYCFANSDTMRAEAKNAMLKITEEPPKNAYFVLTVIDESTLLETIKSRATVIRLEPYSGDELYEFLKNITQDKDFAYGSDAEDSTNCIWMNCIWGIASTPYELKEFLNYGSEFFRYVDLVKDNISEVEAANAFKSSSKLALHGEDDKYDLGLFWKAFIHDCLNCIDEDPLHYAEGIIVTDKYYKKQAQLGVNLQQLYDSWVFEIRGVWR